MIPSRKWKEMAEVRVNVGNAFEKIPENPPNLLILADPSSAAHEHCFKCSSVCLNYANLRKSCGRGGKAYELPYQSRSEMVWTLADKATCTFNW